MIIFKLPQLLGSIHEIGHEWIDIMQHCLETLSDFPISAIVAFLGLPAKLETIVEFMFRVIDVHLSETGRGTVGGLEAGYLVCQLPVQDYGYRSIIGRKIRAVFSHNRSKGEAVVVRASVVKK